LGRFSGNTNNSLVCPVPKKKTSVLLCLVLGIWWILKRVVVALIRLLYAVLWFIFALDIPSIVCACCWCCFRLSCRVSLALEWNSFVSCCRGIGTAKLQIRIEVYNTNDGSGALNCCYPCRCSSCVPVKIMGSTMIHVM
jgi:hypothetical protein